MWRGWEGFRKELWKSFGVVLVLREKQIACGNDKQEWQMQKAKVKVSFALFRMTTLLEALEVG
jgi:hypothetical protein